MSRLFESFEKLSANSADRRFSPRQSFLYALMAAFIVGAQFVRILAIVHPHRYIGGIWDEVIYTAVWLALGFRFGQAAWERINR